MGRWSASSLVVPLRFSAPAGPEFSANRRHHFNSSNLGLIFPVLDDSIGDFEQLDLLDHFRPEGNDASAVVFAH
jgi:hypothetical protein